MVGASTAAHTVFFSRIPTGLATDAIPGRRFLFLVPGFTVTLLNFQVKQVLEV